VTFFLLSQSLNLGLLPSNTPVPLPSKLTERRPRFVREVLYSIPAIPTEGFSIFPLNLRTNAADHDRLLSRPFQFIVNIHRTIRCYVTFTV
jgi:hypothetical protein